MLALLRSSDEREAGPNWKRCASGDGSLCEKEVNTKLKGRWKWSGF